MSQNSTKYRKIIQKRRNHELIAGRFRESMDGRRAPIFKPHLEKQHTKFPSETSSGPTALPRLVRESVVFARWQEKKSGHHHK